MTPFPAGLQHLDEQAFLALHQLLHRLCAKDLMRFAGQVGNGTVVVLVVLGLLALETDLKRGLRRLLFLSIVLAVVGGTMHGMKRALERDRPASVLVAEFERGEATLEFDEPRLASAFPSGHAATAFALATVLWGWAGALVPAWRRRAVRVALVALAALVGLSRIYAGAHFPLDVLAGALLGTLTVLLLRALLGRFLEPGRADTLG